MDPFILPTIVFKQIQAQVSYLRLKPGSNASPLQVLHPSVRVIYQVEGRSQRSKVPFIIRSPLVASQQWLDSLFTAGTNIDPKRDLNLEVRGSRQQRKPEGCLCVFAETHSDVCVCLSCLDR